VLCGPSAWAAEPRRPRRPRAFAAGPRGLLSDGTRLPRLAIGRGRRGPTALAGPRSDRPGGHQRGADERAGARPGPPPPERYVAAAAGVCPHGQHGESDERPPPPQDTLLRGVTRPSNCVRSPPPSLPIHPHPFPSHGSLALLTGLSAGQGSGPAGGERGLPSTATLFSLPALPTRSHSLTLSLSLSVLSFTRTRARSFLLSLSFSLSLSLALANYVSCSLSPSPSSYLPPLAHQPTGLPASQSPAPPASCFPAHALSLYLSVSLSLCLSISHILVGILGRGQGRSVGGSSRPSPRVQYNGLRMASRGLDNEVEDQKTNSWLRARPLNRSPRSRLRGTMAIPGARTHRLRVAPPFLFS
jgi:hypothetical protein